MNSPPVSTPALLGVPFRMKAMLGGTSHSHSLRFESYIQLAPSSGVPDSAGIVWKPVTVTSVAPAAPLMSPCNGDCDAGYDSLFAIRSPEVSKSENTARLRCQTQCN